MELDAGSSSLDVPLPDLRELAKWRWWERLGVVAAEVEFTSGWNLPPGVCPTLPALRWLSSSVTPFSSPFEPFTRPIPNGVALGVEMTQDTVKVWTHTSVDLVRRIAERAAISVRQTKNSRLVERLMEILGGVRSDNSGNQPAIREVLRSASRSPYGQPLQALVQVALDHADDWPDSFLGRGTNYARDVVSRLARDGLLQPRLRFDCLACGTANSQPADRLGPQLRCDLCGESLPLGVYLASHQKLSWLFSLASHIPREQLSEAFPVMAAISVLSSFPALHSQLPHLAIGLEFESSTLQCEVDVVLLFENDGLPAIVIGEAKASGQELDESDFDHLERLQTELRSIDIDAYILVAKLGGTLTELEHIRLRKLCELGLWPRKTAPGSASLPVCPLVLLRRDLSVDSLHVEHPRRYLQPPYSLGALAISTCQRQLGLARFDVESGAPRPVWTAIELKGG